MQGSAAELLPAHCHAAQVIPEQLTLDLAELGDVWRRHWPRDVIDILELERAWLHKIVDLHVDAEIFRHRAVRRAHLRSVRQ